MKESSCDLVEEEVRETNESIPRHQHAPLSFDKAVTKQARALIVGVWSLFFVVLVAFGLSLQARYTDNSAEIIKKQQEQIVELVSEAKLIRSQLDKHHEVQTDIIKKGCPNYKHPHLHDK